MNGDGHRDIWIDDVTHRGRTGINDGLGHVRELAPAGLAPIAFAECDARFVGRRLGAIAFVSPERFTHSEAGERYSGSHRYGNGGPNAGSLRLFCDDGDLERTVRIAFDSEATGILTYAWREETPEWSAGDSRTFPAHEVPGAAPDDEPLTGIAKSMARSSAASKEWEWE